MNLSVQNNLLSFGSNYKIDLNTKTLDAIVPLHKYDCAGIDIYTEYNYENIQSDSSGEIILDAEDKFDKKIESLLASRGIKFIKRDLYDILDPAQILSRIKLSDSNKACNKKLVLLNTDKVEKLFKQDISYIGYKGKGGIGNRYNQFISYLKTGRDINASEIYISKNEEGLSLSFIDGRHRYSVLRDSGLSEIPFALDDKSLELAKQYGLVV